MYDGGGQTGVLAQTVIQHDLLGRVIIRLSFVCLQYKILFERGRVRELVSITASFNHILS